MKKTISISLALLMLVSNIGFAMNTHFCGGQAVETTFTLGLGHPDCGMSKKEQKCQNMPSEQGQIKSRPCCENNHRVFQTEDTAKTQSFSYGINTVFLVAFVQGFIYPVILADKDKTLFSDYTPPPPEKDVQVLFQTFLI